MPRLKFEYVALLILAAVSTLAYSNSLQNGFVYDDNTLIVNNERIRDWHSVLEDLSWYRSLNVVTYAIEYHFWKLNPFGFHLTNVLLHAFCILALFFLVSRLFKRRFLSLVIPLLFAIHPVETEAVDSIANRFDLLATLFLLLSIVFYARKNRSIWMYVLSVLCFFLGLLSKETVAITIPILLLAYDVWFAPAGAAARTIVKNLRYYAAYIAVLIPYLLVGSYQFLVPGRIAHVTRLTESLGSTAAGSPGTGVGIWAAAVVKNLLLLVFPYNLSADYPFPRMSGILEPRAIISLLLCVAFLATIAVTFMRWRGISFGLFWIFVTLMPVTNIVPLTPHFVAERYLYVSSIGFCMALGLVLDKVRTARIRILSPSSREVFVAAIVGIILASYSVVTVRRNFDWRSDYVLWLKTVKQQPASSVAHANLAIEYEKKGRLEDAMNEYQLATEISPGFAMAHFGLGSVCQKLGLVDKAVGEFKLATKFEPGLAIAHGDLAGAYIQKGMFDEARQESELALGLDPNLAVAHYNLGTVYRQMNLYDRAEEEYILALQLDPGLPDVHYGLGAVYLMQNRIDESIQEFEEALARDPASGVSHYGLAVAYLKKGLRYDAQREYEKAVEINPAFSVPPYALRLQ